MSETTERPHGVEDGAGPRRLPGVCARAAFAIALALFAGLACQDRSERPAAPSIDANAGVRLEGKVRFADHWIDVPPAILHDAKMDLATRCRLLQSESHGRGVEVPLCFAQARRDAGAITAIRVEREGSLPQAMHRLTRETEGAHFVIDVSGGTYQILDLAFAARRAGAFPANEIRVIACNLDAERALVAALQRLYPAAQVTTVPAQGATTPQGAPTK